MISGPLSGKFSRSEYHQGVYIGSIKKKTAHVILWSHSTNNDVFLTLSGQIFQLRRFHVFSAFVAQFWRGCSSSGGCIPAASSCNRLAGAIPFFPLNWHSHQPSRPTTCRSMIVKMSPRRNANSSGVSAMLSYSALPRHICEEKKNKN